MAFPRHDEAIPANRGDRYVYGELSVVGDCLRISYVDQVDREGTRHGLLVVWPAGFDFRTGGDDEVEVIGRDGIVTAAEGQTLRLSGRKVLRQAAAIDRWDWRGGDVGHCAGPFWLVGDEVTAMTSGTSGAKPADGIFFPRLNHQRGPIISPLAGMEGQLTLRGNCLRLETPYPPGAYLVVWPPGFSVDRARDDLVVMNGGGSAIAEVGDDIRLGGRSGKAGSDYSDECPGAYFLAYSVQPAGQ